MIGMLCVRPIFISKLYARKGILSSVSVPHVGDIYLQINVGSEPWYRARIPHEHKIFSF